jgi:magnesium chelatase family protein
LAKVSGSLMDRIDLHIEVPALRLAELTESAPSTENSSAIRERILAWRERQRGRLKASGIYCNAQMGAKQVKEHCGLDDASRQILKMAISRLGLSARSFDRILKVARTLADLAGADALREEHVAEAIGYRSFDRPLTYSCCSISDETSFGNG